MPQNTGLPTVNTGNEKKEATTVTETVSVTNATSGAKTSQYKRGDPSKVVKLTVHTGGLLDKQRAAHDRNSRPLPPESTERYDLVPPYEFLYKDGQQEVSLLAASPRPRYAANCHFVLRVQQHRVMGDNERTMSVGVASWDWARTPFFGEGEYYMDNLPPREVVIPPEFNNSHITPFSEFRLLDLQDGVYLEPTIGGRYTVARRAPNLRALRILYHADWELTQTQMERIRAGQDGMPFIVIKTGVDDEGNAVHRQEVATGSKLMLTGDLHAYLRCAARDPNPFVASQRMLVTAPEAAVYDPMLETEAQRKGVDDHGKPWVTGFRTGDVDLPTQ